MRFIKLAIISFFVISAIILAISSMMPDEVKIMRSINLPVSKEKAIELVSNMEDWNQWNIFVNDTILDNLQLSKDKISSEQLSVIKKEFKNDSLITHWNQNGFDSFDGGFVFYGDENIAVVQWYFDIKVKWYPWEKFSSTVYEKQIGPVMEKSLERLKGVLHK